LFKAKQKIGHFDFVIVVQSKRLVVSVKTVMIWKLPMKYH